MYVVWIFAVAALLMCVAGSVFAYREKMDQTACGYMKTVYHPTQQYSIKLYSTLEQEPLVSEVAAVFHKQELTVEIYRQSAENLSYETYIGYSNSFLQNKADHTTVFAGYRKVGKRKMYVTQWYRQSLPHIVEDECHYLTYDIKEKDAWYSIFFKSAHPIEDMADYDAMAASFRKQKSAPKGAELLTVRPWHRPAVDREQRNWNEETDRFYRNLAEENTVRWGIFETGVVRNDWDTMANREATLGVDFEYLLCYSHFYRNPTENPYLPIAQILQKAWERGKILELTLQMKASADGRNYIYDILRGEYDVHLYQYAREVAEFGHPVLFRVNNEMNGDWCCYCAFHTSKDTAIYRAAYHYIYDIFEKNGANRNVLWIWNPNERSFPDFAWNHALAYYPGDEYVDMIGLTAYNTGTFYEAYGETWKSFEELYEELYDRYSRWFDLPFVITEFSCAAMGGDKCAWVEDMFRVIKKLERIKIAIWWNHMDFDGEGNIARDYRIDHPEEMIGVIRRYLGK